MLRSSMHVSTAMKAVILTTMVAGQVPAAPIERASDDAGTIYRGAIGDNDWGRPVAAGDLDGDGFDEVIVAASEDFGGLTSRVYVVRGDADADFRGTIDLAAGGVDLTIIGAAIDDNLGSSIATGDVNGDGIDDLLMCASGADFGGLTGAGIAYLLYGGPSLFASPTRDLSSNGTWDVRIIGPVSGGDMGAALFFGGADTHAADIGNLNGDAFGDIALGVHRADGNASLAGRVYAVAGQAFASGTTLQLANSADYLFAVLGRNTEDLLGEEVHIGDITGDGLDELILPNNFFSQTLFSTEGAVHIFRGRTTWPGAFNLGFNLSDITLLGARRWDELGEAAALGDYNGDGILDLAVAAPGADVGAQDDDQGDGLVYGLLGTNGLQTGGFIIDYEFQAPDFLVRGEFQQGLGAEMAAGDFNGDGIDDVAAAQRFAGGATNGTIDLLFGRDFAPAETFDAAQTTDVRIVGAPGDRIGFALSASDVDSNGVDEVLFGTPFNNGPFSNAFGTAYVFSLLDGDHDADGDVDLRDYAAFQACFALPGSPATNPPCYVYDFVPDGILDGADVAEFVTRLVGPAPSQ
jgi:hypothetical protein